MAASPADTVIALYQALAPAWVGLRGTALTERGWLDAFLAALPPGGRDVLDLGCGSGEPMARHLIANGCRITGIDAAPAMLDHARAAFPGHRWIAADMRALPPLGRFHGLIAWHSFFHLRPADQRAMFATFRRLAAPGAALLFTTGPAHGEVVGDLEGQPLYHASLDGREYHQLLDHAGFKTVRHVAEDPACGNATVWLARQASEPGPPATPAQ